MSEAWRRKTYYRTRVLIPTTDVLTPPPFPDALVCLDASELVLIRNLLEYAKRRSTFVSAYFDNYYYAPTNEEWDQLQAVVDGLEGYLMADCTEVTSRLDSIKANLDSLKIRVSNLQGAQLTEEQEQVFTYGYGEPTTDVSGLSDDDRCALAQCAFQAGWELTTEVILPASRFVFDNLVPAVVALITTITGGASLPVFLGTWTVYELLQELLEAQYNAAETNLVNWLDSAKQDLVCAFYANLELYADASDVAAATYDDVIAISGEISTLDKLICRLAFGGTAITAARVAQQQSSTWYTTSVVPGYCSMCPGELVTVWSFPPCPQTWIADGSGATCVDDRPRLDGYYSYWRGPGQAFPAGTYNFRTSMYFSSQVQTYKTACGMGFQKSTDGGETWDNWLEIQWVNGWNGGSGTRTTYWWNGRVINEGELVRHYIRGYQQSGYDVKYLYTFTIEYVKTA